LYLTVPIHVTSNQNVFYGEIFALVANYYTLNQMFLLEYTHKQPTLL
jgi:hypothetical protein